MSRFDLYPQPAHEMSAEDRAEEADERRDEYIAEFSPAVAKQLVGSDDFAWSVLVGLSDEAKNSVLQDVGRFFTAFQNSHDSPDALAAIGCALWRDLKPHIEAAATEQAEEKIAADWDRSEAA